MTKKLEIKYGPIEFKIEGDSEFIEKEREIFLATLPTFIPNFINNRVDYSSNQSIVDSYTEQGDYLADEQQANQELLATTTTTAATTLPSSFNEFLTKSGFSETLTDVDKVFFGIYYIEKTNKKNVSSKDIAGLLSDSKHPKPSNISHIFNQLTKKSFIMIANNDSSNKTKKYTLTITGEAEIDRLITSPQQNTPKQTKKNKSSSPSSSNIREEIKNLTRSSLNLNRYDNIKKLKSAPHKVYSIMYIVLVEANIEYLSINSIHYLITTLFNQSISRDNVASVFKSTNAVTHFDKKKNSNTKLIEFKLFDSGIDISKKYLEIDD